MLSKRFYILLAFSLFALALAGFNRVSASPETHGVMHAAATASTNDDCTQGHCERRSSPVSCAFHCLSAQQAPVTPTFSPLMIGLVLASTFPLLYFTAGSRLGAFAFTRVPIHDRTYLLLTTKKRE